ncbi:MAG: hypothetical protein RSB59_03520 [Clostridia bacterium]
MNTYFMEATEVEKIHQGYNFAVENGYTHFQSKGGKGYYGWNAEQNTYIAIAADGSECQELATGNIVLIANAEVMETQTQPIVEVVAVEETQCESKEVILEQLKAENSTLVAKLAELENLTNKKIDEYKEVIAMSQERVEQLEKQIIALQNEIEKLSTTDRKLSVEEFWAQDIDFPTDTTLTVTTKKEYNKSI